MSEGRTFAIGDVHGCAAELHELLERLEITPDDQLLFVGDLIDRGEQSQQVIETVLRLHDYCRVKVVLGNHEAMMLDFIRQPGTPDAGMFIFNGGGATLASYADDHGVYHIPRKHYDFIAGLDLYYETDDCFLVHAGVPEIPLHLINPKHHRAELLWSRAIRRSNYRWSKLIVHGHTQRPSVEIESHRINVDAGCVYGGRLAAVDLRAKQVCYVPRQPPKEPVRLRDRSSRRAAVRFGGEVPVRIHRHGRWLDFITANFSEIGMYIRAASDDVDQLAIGEAIRGLISPADERAVRFHGEVVRADLSRDVIHYGIRIVLLD